MGLWIVKGRIRSMAPPGSPVRNQIGQGKRQSWREDYNIGPKSLREARSVSGLESNVPTTQPKQGLNHRFEFKWGCWVHGQKGWVIQVGLVRAIKTYQCPRDPDIEILLKRSLGTNVLPISPFFFPNLWKAKLLLGWKQTWPCGCKHSLYSVSCKLKLSNKLEGSWRRVGKIVHTLFLCTLRLLFHSQSHLLLNR